jgi:hypothetical protein
MLKNLPKRSSLLALATMAACALAAPSTGLAANWDVVGTTHVLDSSTFSFLAGGALNAGAACTRAQFHADVRSSSTLTFTSSTLDHCTGTAGANGCLVTASATPNWTATANAENNLSITGLRLNATFEDRPGFPGGCALTTTRVVVTGNVSGATAGTSTWDFIPHTLTFNNAPGSIGHFDNGLGTFPATFTTAIRDTTQTLTIT